MNRLRLRIPCPGGRIETVVNDPLEPRRGIALIAHPHPLHGGTMDNKVVLVVAQALYERGFVAVRPNFRGVGDSEGEYDRGRGEVDDMAEIASVVQRHYPGLPLLLAGFSFGAFVQMQVASRVSARQTLLIAPAVTLFDFAAPAAALQVIHGEDDELVPLSAVARWAAAHDVRMTVVPGAGHFFHGRLPELKAALYDLCAC